MTLPFKVGDRVRLPELDNGDEVLVEGFGVVIAAQEEGESGGEGDCMVVQLDDEYIDGEDDDGQVVCLNSEDMYGAYHA